MKDRTFLIMWGLTLIMVGALMYQLFIGNNLLVANHALLNHITQEHHKILEMPVPK